MRFGSLLPFLALSCDLSSPYLEIFAGFIKIIRFLRPMQAGNGSGGVTVVQGSSPDGPWHHNLHCITVNIEKHKKSLKFTKNHEKTEESAKTMSKN